MNLRFISCLACILFPLLFSAAPASELEGIYKAAAEGTVEDVRLFIEQGVDVNAKGDYGITPLLLAMFNPDIEVLKVLIKNGADVNAKNIDEFTPLHYAATLDASVEVLKALIENGADVNAKDKNGLTPLFMAVGYNPNGVDALKCLLENGADVNMKYEDHTPLDLVIMMHEQVISMEEGPEKEAHFLRFEEIQIILRDAGGKPGSEL